MKSNSIKLYLKVLFILLFLKFVLGTTRNFFSNWCQRMHPVLLENTAFFFFIALSISIISEKYLKELNFPIFDPGNISSRSKFMRRALIQTSLKFYTNRETY